ncbi:HU family DNA-binding protein [Ancylomarina sp. DW003]|nr:HU family DNA-binding protein [Ancylomarina sp. DW003]MDE5423882.1 HU family DNA-binding protein [Ancylomarina sp. DW003]
MAVYYKPVKIKTPLSKDGKKEKFYPRVGNRKKEDLRDIAERISEMSTFSRSDVVGVLEAFTQLIPQLLKDNTSVELGDLGTFSLHISAEGVDSEELVTRYRIKKSNIAFRPSKRLKENMVNIDYRKIPKK